MDYTGHNVFAQQELDELTFFLLLFSVRNIELTHFSCKQDC